MGFLNRLGRTRILRIRTYGEPVLRETASQIAEIDDEIRDLADRMTTTMYENETRGIGLAAPQVGVGLRLVTIDTRGEGPPAPDASPGELILEPRMPLALVNPELTPAAPATSSYCEGCLSIPEVAGDVVRPTTVRLKAQLLDGTPIDLECGGLLARCLQHEIDHLDGVMFVDRMEPDEREEIADQLRALERLAKKRLAKERR